jgi:hypothetical protein
LIDINDFNAFKSKIEGIYAEMNEKNKRIYFDAVPDINTLPKAERLIKVNPTPVPEDISGSEGGNSSLDALVPREVRGMVGTYKSQMMNFISENLDKYENDIKISTFLSELGLPFSLETCVNTNEIPDYLWKKISEVQQNGGAIYMTNQLSNIDRRGEEIMRRLNDLEALLKHEEDEDNKYRGQSMYGNRWRRNPSNTVNGSYFNIIWEYKSKEYYLFLF